MPEYSCQACGGTGSYEGKLRGKVACEHCGAQWYKLRRIGEGGAEPSAPRASAPRRAATPRVGGTPAQQRCLAMLRRGAVLYIAHDLGPIYAGKYWQADPPAMETLEALEAAGLVTRTELGPGCTGHPSYQVTLAEAAHA